MQVLVSHGSLLGSCKTSLLLLFTHFHQNLGRVQGEIKDSLCKIRLLHREVNIVAVRGAFWTHQQLWVVAWLLSRFVIWLSCKDLHSSLKWGTDVFFGQEEVMTTVFFTTKASHLTSDDSNNLNIWATAVLLLINLKPDIRRPWHVTATYH